MGRLKIKILHIIPNMLNNSNRNMETLVFLIESQIITLTYVFTTII